MYAERWMVAPTREPNKLECFVPCRRVQPSLMFPSKAGAYLSEASFRRYNDVRMNSVRMIDVRINDVTMNDVRMNDAKVNYIKMN